MATSKGKSKNKGAAKAKAAKPATQTKAKPVTQAKTGKAKTAATSSPEPETIASGRHRWKDMSLADLQALYAEKVGRPTDSDDRNYLAWKIREAEKGNIPVGPGKRKLFEGPTTPVTIKLEDEFLAKLDEATKDDGFKTRLAYLRDLIGRGLQVRGRSELAAMVSG